MPAPQSSPALDLVDVQGQREGVQALIATATGANNIPLTGPPGTGKTMLAQRLPSILPPLEHAEAVDVLRIHSLGESEIPEELHYDRPFRRLMTAPPRPGSSEAPRAAGSARSSSPTTGSCS